MSATAPTPDPHAPLLLTAWVDEHGDVVIAGDGVPLLKLAQKQALHLIARLSVAIALEMQSS